ncbi:MAG: PIN domain-containing protein [Oscillospiraceae bacterium]|nr:PIN domain-containing protein [Oscillospiraceae bacterium]
MPDRAFLDTNVLVYLHSEDDDKKRNVAQNLLDEYKCVTSLQTFNELSNVWFRKFNLDAVKIEEHLDNIELVCDNILSINRATINSALALKTRYNFSYYDSLMLASAIEGDCNVIFTEDMSSGQVISNSLLIKNPFN